MLRLNRILNGCLLICIVSVLVACSDESDGLQTLTLSTPRSDAISNRGFTDFTGAGVEVSINGTAPVQYALQQSDTWVVSVDGIVYESENTVSLRWFVVVEDVSYDIATQTETFFVEEGQSFHTTSTNYDSDQFDHDRDSVSNLIELSAGGFPYAAEREPVMIPITVNGCFLLGSPESEHASLGYFNESQVEICNLSDFSIGRYEITYEQYNDFANATGRPLPNTNGWTDEELPVTNVRWIDARDYTVWLSTITGLNYSLPTESQWEFAARGNTMTAFHTGESIDTTRANYNELSESVDPLAVHVQPVDESDNSVFTGVFRFDGTSQWVEYGIDPESLIETEAFSFAEIQRDSDGILIRDDSRLISLRLAISRGGVYLLDNTNTEGLLYNIVAGPETLTDRIGVQAVPVGSFPANAFGLQDVHGNVWEWTCSVLEPSYRGAEQVCTDQAPVSGDVTRMIKRGGGWLNQAFDVRSANRGWNNTVNTSDTRTGFRVVVNP